MTNQYTTYDGRARFAVGKLNSKKPIETAIYEIRGWLGKLGLDKFDVKFDYDPRINVALIHFKYSSKEYEFRSTAQRDCRLNMWAIQHVIEYKVRAHIMQIEKFETSMSPYLALGSSQTPTSTAKVAQDLTAYVIFGLPQTASNEQLKKRYQELVKSYHPDMLAGINSPEARKEFEKRMMEINEAWQKIKAERGIE